MPAWYGIVSPVQFVGGAGVVLEPTVSQHLLVLEEAGLVAHWRHGTRNIYELDSAGVRALRDWVDGLWNEALARFKAAAEAKGEAG